MITSQNLKQVGPREGAMGLGKRITSQQAKLVLKLKHAHQTVQQIMDATSLSRSIVYKILNGGIKINPSLRKKCGRKTKVTKRLTRRIAGKINKNPLISVGKIASEIGVHISKFTIHRIVQQNN